MDGASSDPQSQAAAAAAGGEMPGAPKELPPGVEIVNGQYVFKDADGTSYEWDAIKQAWFPMWQDDLVTSQQSAYGTWEPEKNPALNALQRVVDEEEDEEDYDEEEEFDLGDGGVAAAGMKRKAPKEKKGKGNPGTQQQGKPPNSVVYVTGLPEDVTVEEMKDFFSKCGVIKIDFETDLPKIKLYKDENGRNKGDGWVSYLKPESVPLAIQILDGADFRPGLKVSVTEAKFDHQGENKKKRKIDKKMIRQKMQKLEKKLQWYDEDSGVKAKYARVVILKHMFTLEEIERDPGLIIDLKEDIREECGKLGEVSSIMLFDKSEEGVCSVKFATEEAATACVELMNGRYFAGRKVEAEIYDGKAKYTTKAVGEDAEKEEAERLENFAKWLESKK